MRVYIDVSRRLESCQPKDVEDPISLEVIPLSRRNQRDDVGRIAGGMGVSLTWDGIQRSRSRSNGISTSRVVRNAAAVVAPSVTPNVVQPDTATPLSGRLASVRPAA